MKRILSALSALCISVAVFAQPNPKDYQFTTVKENPITSIKNQFKSGTCWCFSTLSFIESEILRTSGKEVDLSEMFVVNKAYRDRAVKYVRLDGHMGFSAGSSSGDVFTIIKKYGIMPQEAYCGLNYGTELPVQGELDAVLKGYVDAIVRNPNRELTPAWAKGFGGILDAYLGEIPESFTDDGVSYTPESYRDALKINTDDYVNFASFQNEELYKPFVIEVCDNWRWGTAYNVTMDEMMEIMYHAIENGYTIAWGGDVSEKDCFTRTGLGIMPKPQDNKVEAGSDQEHWVGKDTAEKPEEKTVVLPEELPITDEMRQDAYDRKLTTDDHGMHFYGIATDQNGTKYFKVKNSWGESSEYKGIWYMSDSYVRYKTLNIFVHKDGIPKEIKKKIGIK